jgi:O-antigen ligase
MFVFTVPWENMFTLTQVGTIARGIGIAAAICGVLGVLFARRVILNPFWIAGIPFVVWSWLSIWWTVDHDMTKGRAFTYMQIWLMVWLIQQYSDTRFLEKLLTAYLLGASVAAVATIHAYQTGLMVAYQRFAARGFDPNDLCFYLVIAVPVAAYLGMQNRKPILALLYFGFVPLAAYSIVLTASRAGLMAFFLAVLFLLYSLTRLQASRGILALALVGVLLMYALGQIPEQSFARMSTLMDELQKGTWNDRLIIWQAGLEVASHHPVLGTGAGTFRVAVASYLHGEFAPHNAFVAITVEEGVVGTTLWLLWVAYPFSSVAGMPYRHALFWLTICAVILLAFLTLNFEWRKVPWLMLAIASTYANPTIKFFPSGKPGTNQCTSSSSSIA